MQIPELSGFLLVENESTIILNFDKLQDKNFLVTILFLFFLLYRLTSVYCVQREKVAKNIYLYLRSLIFNVSNAIFEIFSLETTKK